MREITYALALREAMREEMTKDPDMILLGEDIGVWGGPLGCNREAIQGVSRQSDRYPDFRSRYRRCGIRGRSRRD